jgi:hypothetical protein
MHLAVFTACQLVILGMEHAQALWQQPCRRDIFRGDFSAGAEILVKFSHDRGGVGSAH